MKKIAFSTVAAALLCGAILAGCAKGSNVSYAQMATSASGGSSTSRSMKTATYESADMAAYDDEVFMEEAPEPVPTEGGAGTTASTIERKLIRTGRISTEVDSLADTRDMLNNWVKKYNGYISDSSESGRRLYITARIPSRHFDQAMNDALGMGRLNSKNVNSEDVTDQYYDLATRLSTKRVMLERLQNYLKEAKDVKDMIEIESKINDVTTEIESMQGRLNRLAALVDYSTISVEAYLPANQTERGFTVPDTRNAFREFLGNTLSFFVGFFFAVLYVIIFGIPIVLVLCLLFWICFGKIGLLRRLFAKIRAKKE